MEDKKTCRKCGDEKPINKFRIRRKGDAIFADNICMACRGKTETARLRLEMFEAFGWKCYCCGEEHPQFLTLEHVNGGRHFYGRRYGRDENSRQSNTYVEIRRAKREGWDRTNWELLCMNCNHAKGHYGQCPHRSGIGKEQVLESLKQTMKGIGYTARANRGSFKDGFDARRNPSKQEVAHVLKEIVW